MNATTVREVAESLWKNVYSDLHLSAREEYVLHVPFKINCVLKQKSILFASSTNFRIM